MWVNHGVFVETGLPIYSTSIFTPISVFYSPPLACLSSCFQAGKLLTSWVGYGLNYLRYKFTMDNSLSGSRSNIEAHYDLSNDLFKIFLDKNLMLYSSGVFQADMGRYSFNFHHSSAFSPFWNASPSKWLSFSVFVL